LSIVTLATMRLLTVLHPVTPHDYGAGPPCNDNPFHLICVGPGPSAMRYVPSGWTWQGEVAVGILIAAGLLILTFCAGFAYRSLHTERG
jgi:hypothetical protein